MLQFKELVSDKDYKTPKPTRKKSFFRSPSGNLATVGESGSDLPQTSRSTDEHQSMRRFSVVSSKAESSSSINPTDETTAPTAATTTMTTTTMTTDSIMTDAVATAFTTANTATISDTTTT